MERLVVVAYDIGFTSSPKAFVVLEVAFKLASKRTFSCKRIFTATRPVILSLEFPISCPNVLLYPKETL